MSWGFPTRSDTNGAVKAQGMAICLAFRIQEEERLYTELSNVLISCAVTAQLCLCFRILI